VPEQLLHGANVLTVFEQVRCERMAKSVGAYTLGETGSTDRGRDLLLHN
jgi:hypothetical protein